LKLPEHTTITSETIQAIAYRHGLRSTSYERLPETGIVNAIYALGDEHILRVPRNHLAHVAQAYREAIAIPAARRAGVRTPRLVAFDDALDLLPVPYLIVERVDGDTLGLVESDPLGTPEVWREVGRELARLHLGVGEDGPADESGSAYPFEASDLPELVERRATDGWYSSTETRWLLAWVDRLAPRATLPVPRRFVHADVQATNVMIDTSTREYEALIDWGCAHWSDPALDFIGMPLRAVPLVLAGYRDVGPLDGDDAAEARILWHHLKVALFLMPRGAAPGCSWGEQPIAMLLDIFRFFLEDPGPTWNGLGPP